MNCPPEAKDNIVLVGNKVDLDSERQVLKEDCESLVKKHQLLAYFEASASSNTNVD